MKRRLLRLGAYVLVPVVVLAACAGGLFYAFIHKFNPEPPVAVYAKPANALEAQRQDIDYFTKLIALDRAYASGDRAEANRRLAVLASAKTVLDRAHMRVALMEIAALADNGHTGVNSKAPTRAAILPIRLSAFSEGLFVLRAKAANADLLGAQVLRIDGHPLDEVLTRLEQLRGGTKAFRLSYAQWILNSSEILYGLGIAPAPDRSTWTFRTRTGETVERSFAGSQPDYDDPTPDLWRWMSPLPVKGDKTQWSAFAPDGLTLPRTFADPDRVFRRVRIDAACTMLIQLKSNADENGEKIRDFLRATEADLDAAKPCSVILDDRFNGGGNYTNTAGFAGRLPSLVRPGGHIYILTGPNTFSAGITTVVFVKQAAAPGQAVILGEPVGDRMAFWAEGQRGCVPNGPFCFHYATGLHDYAHPCTDWDKCFWLNWIYKARTDNLRPNETIEMRYVDYLAGRDPVFDRALQLASTH